MADTIVKRWQDHLPLHRMESIFRRRREVQDTHDQDRGLLCADRPVSGEGQRLGDPGVPRLRLPPAPGVVEATGALRP
jgi:hypothetical protein